MANADEPCCAMAGGALWCACTAPASSPSAAFVLAALDLPAAAARVSLGAGATATCPSSHVFARFLPLCCCCCCSCTRCCCCARVPTLVGLTPPPPSGLPPSAPTAAAARDTGAPWSDATPMVPSLLVVALGTHAGWVLAELVVWEVAGACVWWVGRAKLVGRSEASPASPAHTASMSRRGDLQVGLATTAAKLLGTRCCCHCCC